MKQELITYLSTMEDILFSVSAYLYENPEESFNEYKAYTCITDLLKDNNFKVEDQYLEIPTAFFAQLGSGHPKICYLCEYDAFPKDGHVSGHNLVSAMSLGAALSLAKIIPKIGGSVIVLGCPGEYSSGAKVTMAKQGVFNDIDVALMAHPNTFTAETGSSSAILPLKIEYTSKCGFSYKNIGTYSSLDACLLTLNALQSLTKGLPEDCTLDGVVVNGGTVPSQLPCKTECKFYIRASTMPQAVEIERKIREFVKAISSILNIESTVSIYELPYDELIPNSTLSRIFSHNLKESGIINILEPKATSAGLSIGTVSHFAPCIHPFISITENDTLPFPSKEFADTTLTPFAKKQILKTAQALALTGFDLIQNEPLLKEIKMEFSNKTT